MLQYTGPPYRTSNLFRTIRSRFEGRIDGGQVYPLFELLEVHSRRRIELHISQPSICVAHLSFNLIYSQFHLIDVRLQLGLYILLSIGKIRDAFCHDLGQLFDIRFEVCFELRL